jgi:biopolymer transport protein ExbD
MEAGTAITVPAEDEGIPFTVTRDGSVTFENEPIGLTDLAATLTRLAAQIRQSALAIRMPLDAKRGLPAVICIRGDGEIRCANILRILIESGKSGFRRFALKSPDTEAPADRPAESKAASATRHNKNDPPAGLRTIPISIAADDRGRIACAEIGEVQHATFEALRTELTSMLCDPDLPFDRVSIRVDPRLVFSELIRTTDLLLSLKVTGIDLTPLETDER